MLFFALYYAASTSAVGQASDQIFTAPIHLILDNFPAVDVLEM
jgi:hypothetical protein